MSSTGHTSTRQAHHCPHPTSRGVPFARPDLRGPTRIDRFAKPGLVAHENRVIAARAKDSDLEINHFERMIFAPGENKAEYIQLSGTNMAVAVVSGAGLLDVSALKEAKPAVTSGWSCAANSQEATTAMW